jgi:Arc/MetJ-type ribon-helix-helix transcriptional regulator
MEVGKMAKVMISIPDEFLKELDRVSKAEHRTRSELFREAIRHYIYGFPLRNKPADNPEVKNSLRSLDELKDKWRGKWDSAEAIRKMRDGHWGQRK